MLIIRLENLRQANHRLSCGPFLLSSLWHLARLIEARAACSPSSPRGYGGLTSLPQVLLDILVQVLQILPNLEMLVHLDRLFKASLDLFLPLLAFDELLNLCRCSVLLVPLVVLP